MTVFFKYCLLTTQSTTTGNIYSMVEVHIPKQDNLKYFTDLSFHKNATYFSAQKTYLKMATVVGVTAINVKTTVKKKLVRNKGKNLHCVGHFPGTAS